MTPSLFLRLGVFFCLCALELPAGTEPLEYKPNARDTSWLCWEHVVPLGIVYDRLEHGYPLPPLVSGNHILAYIPSWREDDSLHFFHYNLSTRTARWLSVHVPGISTTLRTPLTHLLAFRDSTVVMVFPDTVFFVLFLRFSDSALSLQRVAQLPRPYWYFEYLRILQDGNLLLARCYRRNISGDSGNAMLLVLEKTQLQPLHELHLIVSGIELTHWGPAQLVDARDTLIAFVDPGRYSVRIFNSRLQELYRLERTPPEWKQIPLDSLKAIAKRADIWVKQLLEEGNIYATTYSRIESVNFLDSKHLLVRYRPGVGSEEEDRKYYRRFYDVWYLGTTPRLLYADLKERAPAPEEVVDSCHVFLPYSIPGCWLPWVAVLYYHGAPSIPKFGQTYGEYVRQREEYFKDHDPEFVLEVGRFLLPLRP